MAARRIQVRRRGSLSVSAARAEHGHAESDVCGDHLSRWRLDGMFVILSLASGSDARPECPAAHAARFGGKSSPVADTHHVIPQKRLFVFFFRKERSERISRIDDSQRSGILVDDGDVYEATLLHRRQDIG